MNEPDYMELRKDSKAGKESEHHIYELDVPKVPGSTGTTRDGEKSTAQQQSALEYHYVRSCEPSVTVSRIHASTMLASNSNALENRLREELDKKLKGRKILARRKRSCSTKLLTLTLLFILTILNMVLAIAALAIGGSLYSRIDAIERELGLYNNNTQVL